MTDPRETLNRIRKQADNATEGPWEADGSAHVLTAGNTPTFVARCADPDDSDAGVPDAEFVAAARTTVPALLDALEAVLAVHAPDYTYPDCPKCAECSDIASTAARRFAVLWPCETVEAITTALDAIK